MENTYKDVFAKCRRDLVKEGIVKSALFGAIAGFGVGFIIAFVTWFTDFNGLWLALGMLVAVTATVSVVLYFKVYRPNNKAVADRLDRVGFDERMITMLELENDDSYIAQRQRADAMGVVEKAAAKNGGKLLSVKIATAVIAVSSVLIACGVGMTTVTGLAAYGVIPGGKDLWNKVFPSESSFATVRYEVSDGKAGSIDGDVEQKVLVGEGSSTVYAYAVDGYQFVKWIDDEGNEYVGNGTAHRLEKVTRSITFTAVFEEVDDMEDDPEDSTDPNKDSGDNPGDMPDFGGPSDPSTGEPGGPNGGSNSSNNNDNDKIIDGETDYKEKYEYYYQLAMQKLANGEEIPPELRAILESYFGVLL